MNDQNQASPADVAASTIRSAPIAVANHPDLRPLLPSDASSAMLSAVGAGVAARMVADLVLMTLPVDHPLRGATLEYLSLSMGMLCHFTESDADHVSRVANEMMDVLNRPEASEVGQPGIIVTPPIH